MLGRMIRVLFGFVVACLAAGLTIVLFVTTPVELANTPSDAVSDTLIVATACWPWRRQPTARCSRRPSR